MPTYISMTVYAWELLTLCNGQWPMLADNYFGVQFLPGVLNYWS